MKIVYASGTPLAGVSELMTRMANQYLAPEHEARCLSKGTGLHSAWYRRSGVEVPWASIKSQRDVSAALEWADVVHCMANVSANTMRRADLLDKKVWVFQWHGAQIWPFERVWRRKDYRHVRWIHIGQGWTRQDFFKRFQLTIIPNLISIHDPIHMPVPYEERKARAAFAPSNMRSGAVNDKGVAVVKQAAARAGAKVDLIHGMKFDLCMRRKSMAILGIDEVVSPLYHRSGLEFLAQGTPCICSYDDFTVDCLEEGVGTRDVPFVNSTRKGLAGVLRRHMTMPRADLRNLGERARRWMEQWYCPKILLKRYLEVYNR